MIYLSNNLIEILYLKKIFKFLSSFIVETKITVNISSVENVFSSNSREVINKFFGCFNNIFDFVPMYIVSVEKYSLNFIKLNY